MSVKLSYKQKNYTYSKLDGTKGMELF